MVIETVLLCVAAVASVFGALFSMAASNRELRAHVREMHNMHAEAMRQIQARSLQEFALAEQMLNQEKAVRDVQPRSDEYERYLSEKMYGSGVPSAMGGMHESMTDVGPTSNQP